MSTHNHHLTDGVVIFDFGSQYTQLIARRIRELKVYCEIHPFDKALAVVRATSPKAIVLSGGPRSVLGEDAPQVDTDVFAMGLPVLGICYGMQLMCHLLGGKVERANDREFGPAHIEIRKATGMFSRQSEGARLPVWMSHGDRVKSLPPGFDILASSEGSPFAAAGDPQRDLYGVQFHPEVVHTPQGSDMLAAFLFDVSGIHPNWTPESFVEETVRGLEARIEPDARLVCGLSGGVDSSVAAVLVSKAVGDRLTCIFVDNGLLRANEAQQVLAMFREHFQLNVLHVDASDAFLSALKGVTDPEQKRKTIGRLFIEVFEREAKRIEGAKYLVQGTLYPDVIESVSSKGPSAVIKSHHNVGGLPERMQLSLVEPLRELFKDEVREVGKAMGMPPRAIQRQPFPGPGLAIRCLGEVRSDRLQTLRQADAILLEEIRAASLYHSLWQSFCVLLPVETVGVMGDERTYEQVIAVRAVESIDGMTADWARLPYELLAKVSSRIINEVRGCNRVVYDISSKPPATIEWE